MGEIDCTETEDELSQGRSNEWSKNFNQLVSFEQAKIDRFSRFFQSVFPILNSNWLRAFVH